MISIIIPIYNIEQYVRECIESIISQDYQDIEIILVDDGSTDLSGQICDEYSNIDNRIVVLHDENCGLVRARKRGLDKATGDYVIFVDGDDTVEIDMCSKMLTYIAKYDVDFVHTDFKIDHCKCKNIIKDEIVYFDRCGDDKRIELLKNSIFSIDEYRTVNRISPSIWSKIYKIDVIRYCYEMVPDTQSYGEDLLCLCSLILNCKSIAIVNDAYYNYRIRANSLSHQNNDRHIANNILLRRELIALFKRNRCYADFANVVDYYIDTNIYTYLEKKGETYSRYYYKNVEDLYGKRIVIYGAGKVGKDYYVQISQIKTITVVNWVDKKYYTLNSNFRKINAVESLSKCEFDYIIIAVFSAELFMLIRDELVVMGIQKTRILWEKPQQKKLNHKYDELLKKGKCNG